MEIIEGKHLVLVKWFQLLFIQLLYVSIVESIKSNEVFMQNVNNKYIEKLDSSSNITSIDLIKAGKTLSQMTDCSMIPGCLRCNEMNGCIKCTNFLMKDSRKCIDKCPTKYINQWSSSSELMGKICVQLNIYNSLQTILVGIICGTFLCFFIVFVSIMILKKRQHKLQKKLIKDQLINDEYDQVEFIKQLDELRPFSEYFLFMLNDTRKQIRKSYLSGDTTAAAKFYPIIRDLAKILIILNRQIEMIDGPPHDWNRLLQWAERILAQCKSQQQTKEFIEFLQASTLQSPSHMFNNEDARLVSDHTTFKSLFYSTPVVQNRKKILLPSTKSSNTDHKHTNEIKYDSPSKEYIHAENLEKISKSDIVANDSSISLISLQDFVKEEAENKTHHSINLDNDLKFINSYHSKASLQVVDDDLIEFKLGLRPQDEIITEL